MKKRQPLSRVPKGHKKLDRLDIKAIAETIHAHFPGRQAECGFMFRARNSTANGIEAMREMVEDEGYRPEVTGIDALTASSDLLTGQALVDFQVFWASELVRHPWELLGKKMMTLIRERGETLAPEVWPIIIPWFGENHPAAKAFFAQRAILKKTPAGAQATAALSALPGGRQRGLAGKVLTGERTV